MLYVNPGITNGIAVRTDGADFGVRHEAERHFAPAFAANIFRATEIIGNDDDIEWMDHHCYRMLRPARSGSGKSIFASNPITLSRRFNGAARSPVRPQVASTGRRPLTLAIWP